MKTSAPPPASDGLVNVGWQDLAERYAKIVEKLRARITALEAERDAARADLAALVQLMEALTADIIEECPF